MHGHRIAVCQCRPALGFCGGRKRLRWDREAKELWHKGEAQPGARPPQVWALAPCEGSAGRAFRSAEGFGPRQSGKRLSQGGFLARGSAELWQNSSWHPLVLHVPRD